MLFHWFGGKLCPVKRIANSSSNRSVNWDWIVFIIKLTKIEEVDARFVSSDIQVLVEETAALES